MKGKILVLIMVLGILLLSFADSTWSAENQIQLREYHRTVHRLMVQSGTPPGEADQTIAAMVRAHFTKKQMLQVGELMNSGDSGARAAIRNKVHEGIAKKVDPQRIVAAAASVQRRYTAAIQLAAASGLPQRQRMASIYVDCLAAGLQERDAQSLSEALSNQGQSRATQNGNLWKETLLTTRAMVRQGVSSGTATQTVLSALGQNYSAKEMTSLRTSLAQCSGNLEYSARSLKKAINNGSRGAELQQVATQARQRNAFGEGSGSGNGGGSDASGGAGGSSSSGGSNGSSGSGSSGGSSNSGSSGGSESSGNSGGSGSSGGSGGSGGSRGGSNGGGGGRR